jgi:hypothetical protein
VRQARIGPSLVYCHLSLANEKVSGLVQEAVSPSIQGAEPKRSPGNLRLDASCVSRRGGPALVRQSASIEKPASPDDPPLASQEEAN